MIVMFGNPSTLMLGITAQDIDDIAGGKMLEYFGTHRPYGVQRIEVLFGDDKQAIVEQVERRLGTPMDPIAKARLLGVVTEG